MITRYKIKSKLSNARDSSLSVNTKNNDPVLKSITIMESTILMVFSLEIKFRLVPIYDGKDSQGIYPFLNPL